MFYMKKIWHIAFIDIKRMVRDKTYFFWTLLFPLVFIFIFGSIYKGDTQPTVAALVVLNRDTGPWGVYFIEKIKAPGIDVQVVDKEPAEYSRILVIPEDFSQKITDKKVISLFSFFHPIINSGIMHSGSPTPPLCERTPSFYRRNKRPITFL